MADVRNFGAVGDGTTDDTEAIQHAVDDGDGVLEFPSGTYRITGTIEIPLDRKRYTAVVGSHGTARVVMTANGPAFRLVGNHTGTADPTSVKPAIWQHERFPTVSGIEIVGDHPQADGIQLVRTMQATLERVLIRNVRNAVHLPERNRNVLITACHFYDNSGIGVFMDRCNLHQAIITGCHISYNREAGIKSLGGDLHNLQITGNDIEYNYDDEATGAAEIWFDATEGTASEITIASNTIQAKPSQDGVNVRVHGQVDGDGRLSARLITLSANVLGSQSTNVDIRLAERVAITGNTIYDGHTQGIRLEECSLASISGNTFGWSLGPQRNTIDSILLRNCWGCTVSGAVLHAGSYGDETSGGAITLENCEDCSVNNCQVMSPKRRGISLTDCQRCRVDSNSVADRHKPPRSTAGIELSGGGNNVVQNNLLHCPAGEPLRCPDEIATKSNNTIVS